ncbi:metaxin 1 [Anopheles sinensis]|uniref:Metaxin 1 n=1 Tax=Anopheles sinensis TaxID=74873 RepID=A0A084WS69_ANOSI|nr:metaxin 1 [Anopheles sinensis]
MFTRRRAATFAEGTTSMETPSDGYKTFGTKRKENFLPLPNKRELPALIHSSHMCGKDSMIPSRTWFGSLSRAIYDFPINKLRPNRVARETLVPERSETPANGTNEPTSDRKDYRRKSLVPA